MEVDGEGETAIILNLQKGNKLEKVHAEKIMMKLSDRELFVQERLSKRHPTASLIFKLNWRMGKHTTQAAC